MEKSTTIKIKTKNKTNKANVSLVGFKKDCFFAINIARKAYI